MFMHGMAESSLDADQHIGKSAPRRLRPWPLSVRTFPQSSMGWISFEQATPPSAGIRACSKRFDISTLAGQTNSYFDFTYVKRRLTPVTRQTLEKKFPAASREMNGLWHLRRRTLRDVAT